MKNKAKICIVTATTVNFIQWTMVMIHSFLRTNPWFNGEIFVICDELPEAHVADLKLFRQIKLVAPSSILKTKLDNLCRANPKFTNLIAQFYSFETFRFEGYDKVLFLDSDMIVEKSIEEVFNLPDPFYACAESCWYSGFGRLISSYQAVPGATGDDDIIAAPINSGFMLVDHSILNGGHYERLIEMTEPELWMSKNTFHADQLVINLHFRNMITLLDSSFNWRCKDARDVKTMDGIDFEDIKILHYFRRFKPWIFSEVLQTSVQDMNMIRSYDLWYRAYIEFLKFYHLQKKLAAYKAAR
jgi:lipopolysaccharide biosynthesis glycosyltransferase